jgi:ribosomal protein L11 methyltransferase
LAAYGEAGERVAAEFPASHAEEIEPGWEDRWREFHRPVRIGKLWIGPPWEPLPVDAIAVVVDPGRAFGTGAHPTTRLCLELLQELDPTSLLDVGCGSGVLSIAAVALGFGPVTAVDVDPAALEEAERNAAANGMHLDTLLLDATKDELPSAGVTVANISLDGVEALRPAGDRLVTSGYLARETPTAGGYRLLRRRELDGWAADLHEKTS